LGKIEKEESHIGKLSLLSGQLNVVYHSLPSEEARKQIIFFLDRISEYNTQIQAGLKKELAKDNKELKRKITSKFRKKPVYLEVLNNIHSIAKRHHDLGKKHLAKYKENDKSTYIHGHLAKHHSVHAKNMYDIILRKDVKKILQLMAIKLLAESYSKVLNASMQISKDSKEAARIAKSKKGLAKLRQKFISINANVMHQDLILRHFAANYSRTLIHSAELIDNLNKKFVLYTHS